MQGVLERNPEKIDSYSREKERSLEIEKKMIIVFKLLVVSRFL